MFIRMNPIIGPLPIRMTVFYLGKSEEYPFSFNSRSRAAFFVLVPKLSIFVYMISVQSKLKFNLLVGRWNLEE